MVILIIGLLLCSISYYSMFVFSERLHVQVITSSHFLLSFFMMLICFDFYELYSAIEKGEVRRFSANYLANSTGVKQAYILFLLFYIPTQILLVVDFIRTRHFTKWRVTSQGYHRASEYLFYVILGILSVQWLNLWVDDPSNFYANFGNRYYFSNLSTISSFALLLFIPVGIVMLASRTQGRQLFFSALIIFLILSIYGSRGGMIIIVYSVVLFYARVNRLKLSFLFIVSISVIIISIYYTYAFRYSNQYQSIGGFINAYDGVLGYILKSAEASLAEVFTIYYNRAPFAREWYDSIWGAITAIVPRSLYFEKPLGLSAYLTMSADVDRWSLVQSEWTVGGWINLYYELGWLGIPANVIIVQLILKLGRVCDNNLPHTYHAFLVFLLLGYLRGDIVNLGIRVWGCIIVLLCCLFLIKVFYLLKFDVSPSTIDANVRKKNSC